MVNPSILQLNFSFKRIGDNIAVNTIEKQLVDEIRRMFPNDTATKNEECGQGIYTYMC